MSVVILLSILIPMLVHLSSYSPPPSALAPPQEADCGLPNGPLEAHVKAAKLLPLPMPDELPPPPPEEVRVCVCVRAVGRVLPEMEKSKCSYEIGGGSSSGT